MADPVTTIIAAVAGHPAAVALASVYGVAKPFLAKILGPGADELGEIGRDYIKGRRAANAGRTMASADALLTGVGREAQPVPLATVVPLLEGASLQEEPSLAARWAALLANAADPAQRAQVEPSFVDVLRQLTPGQARILELTYQGVSLAAFETGQEADLIIIDGYGDEVGMSPVEFGVCVDNLLRLRLCGIVTRPVKADRFTLIASSRACVVPTIFGYEFLRAITPPIA